MVTIQPLAAAEPKEAYELIYEVSVQGNLPVQRWLRKLKANDFYELYAHFDKLDEEVLRLRPWPPMGNWFKPLRYFAHVWQVASSRQRVLGFREETKLVLTNGFYKTGGETPQAEIRKSTDLRELFKSGK